MTAEQPAGVFTQYMHAERAPLKVTRSKRAPQPSSSSTLHDGSWTVPCATRPPCGFARKTARVSACGRRDFLGASVLPRRSLRPRLPGS